MSYIPLGEIATYDDPQNISGLGSPAILRGTVSATHAVLASGGAVMAGQTATVRAATAAALQAAINYACSANKFFELEPGIYEIASANGLLIPATSPNGSGLTWRGSPLHSCIVQYTTNAPIMTIGDTSGNNITGHHDVRGMALYYGSSQTGNTNATALVISTIAQSNISGVTILGNQAGFGQAYVGVAFPVASFSNTFEDFYVNAGQLHIVNVTYDGSGQIFRNWFCCAGGLNAPVALTGTAWNFANGSNNTTMERVNIEAVSANRILGVGTCRELAIRSLHMETITLTGANPLVFAAGVSRISITDISLDFICSSPGASGTGALFGTYGDDKISMTNCALMTQSTDSALVNLPFEILSPGGTPDGPCVVTATNLSFDDFNGSGLSTHGFLDPNLPLANFNTPLSVRHYEYDYNVSTIRGAIVPVSASYTHYGVSNNATLEVPASLNANATITLSNLQKPFGNAPGMPTSTGNFVTIRRQSGTVANTMTIVDGASGATLATNSTAATSLVFIFNGACWVSATTGTPSTSNGQLVTTGTSATMSASSTSLIVRLATPAAINITLPASPMPFQPYTIKDGGGNASTYPITITPTTGTIDGSASATINVAYQSTTVIYDGTTWNII